MPQGKGKKGKRKGKGGARKGGKKGKRGGGKVPLQTGHSAMTVPKLLTPSETDVCLTEVTKGQLVSAGVGGIAEHFYLNSLLQTSPGVNLIMPGISTYINEYTYYRIPSYTNTITYYNMETFPVEIVNMYTNLDPGTSFGTYSLFQGNPLVSTLVLGASTSGQDMKTHRRRIKAAEITGTTTVETDDTYRAVISANPTDLIWTGHAAIAMGGKVLTALNGVIYRKQTTRMIRFYGRTELNSFREQEYKARVLAQRAHEDAMKKLRERELGVEFERKRLLEISLRDTN